MNAPILLRSRAVNPFGAEPITLGDSLLDLQLLQLTIAAVLFEMTACFHLDLMDQERVRLYEHWHPSLLESQNRMRGLLGLHPLPELTRSLQETLEAVDGLSGPLDPQVVHTEVIGAGGWRLMRYITRGVRAFSPLSCLLTGVVDPDGGAAPRKTLEALTVDSAMTQMFVNLVDEQRRRAGKVRTPYEQIGFPEAGQYRCFDRLDAVARALGNSPSPGNLLVPAQMLGS